MAVHEAEQHVAALERGAAALGEHASVEARAGEMPAEKVFDQGAPEFPRTVDVEGGGGVSAALPEVHQQNRGIDRSAKRGPLLPEHVRQFTRQVDAPAVDAIFGIPVPVRIHPAPGGGKDVLTRTRCKPECVLSQLRECVDAPHPLVTKLGIIRRLGLVPLLHGEPAPVRGALLLLEKIPERPEIGPDMRKLRHHQHFHSPAMRLGDEIDEAAVCRGHVPGQRVMGDFPVQKGRVDRGEGTEMPVDVMEGAGIELVRRPGLEHGQKHDSFHAQVLQIIQALDHPVEVTAVLPQQGGRTEVLMPHALLDGAAIPVRCPV